jgi:preprotein translocase subunit YajC
MPSKMKLSKDILVGEVVEIGGVSSRVQAVKENDYNGIVLELKRQDVKIPKMARSKKQAQKRMKARRSARMTLIVSENKKLKVYSR